MAIQWRDQPILDSVQLPGSDTKYWVADSEAREKIETLIGATRFMGVSTTEITDGGTETPTITDKPGYTQATGDIVIYTPSTGPSLEFIWDGSKWQLLGGQAIENLGDLAYKNSASGSYTPEGNIDIEVVFADFVTNVDGDVDVSIYLSGTNGGYMTNVIKASDFASLTYSSNNIITNIQGISLDSITTDIDTITSAPASIITGISPIVYSSVAHGLSGGELPTITNPSIITATMGTGSSSTTLIFSLSDIGFSSGSFPVLEYTTVYGLSSNSNNITYGSIETSNIAVVTGVSGEIVYSQSTIGIPNGIEGSLYYDTSASLNLTIGTKSAVQRVTADFSGSSATITVS